MDRKKSGGFWTEAKDMMKQQSITRLWRFELEQKPLELRPGKSSALTHQPLSACYLVWSNQSWPVGDYLAGLNKDFSVNWCWNPAVTFTAARFCCVSARRSGFHTNSSRLCENRVAAFPAELPTRLRDVILYNTFLTKNCLNLCHHERRCKWTHILYVWRW